ncbi:TetR/AcrR family transcriptional regulator [Nitriliruptoraceae bacterium ZYF776]|nr:TetR/AcrR family transcriptional regulator [Profundirhabdus halotolerans]
MTTQQDRARRTRETQQDRARKTREMLLAAARRVFAEKGYLRATVADIVAEAGRAHGTFYLYFDNKQDVFAALLDEAIESLSSQSKAMWRHENPTRSVWVTVRRFLEEFGDNQDLWLLFDHMTATDPTFTALRDNWRAEFVARIRRGIESAATPATATLDTQVLAEILAAMVDEVCRVLYLEGRRWHPDTVALHITTLWARGLGYPAADLDELIAEVATGTAVPVDAVG